jgi:hypothetical protein
MGRRQRRRASAEPSRETTDYVDAEGNVLTLRAGLSERTLSKLRELEGGGVGASTEDRWHRRGELLFERLAVRWTIAGLPLEDQKELLGRYRMADSDTRRWVRETVEAHLKAGGPPNGP